MCYVTSSGGCAGAQNANSEAAVSVSVQILSEDKGVYMHVGIASPGLLQIASSS